MSAQEQPASQQGQDVEKLIRDYQVLQEQLRNAAIQLDQLQAAKADFERASKEVESSSGKIYFSVGGIMVETPKEKAQTDLKDRIELTGVRIQAATKQYNEFKEKEKTLGAKLTQMYKQAQSDQSDGVA